MRPQTGQTSDLATVGVLAQGFFCFTAFPWPPTRASFARLTAACEATTGWGTRRAGRARNATPSDAGRRAVGGLSADKTSKIKMKPIGWVDGNAPDPPRCSQLLQENPHVDRPRRYFEGIVTCSMGPWHTQKLVYCTPCTPLFAFGWSS